MDNTEKRIADMIDRYVYDVVRRLPQEQRADIEKELRSLIEDMISDKTGGAAPTVPDAEAVLKELGRPAELAAGYRGAPRHLIGPDYFGIYLLIVKIVIAATVFGIALSMLIGYFVTPPVNVLAAIGRFIMSLLMAAVQAFAWVTVVFALIERFAKNKGVKEFDWKPADLPPVPVNSATIKKGEPITGMVFGVIALIIFNAAPWLLGAYAHIDGVLTPIPVFNLNIFYRMLPLIDVILCLGILKEVCKLVIGRYSIRLAVATTVINILALITFIYVFLSPEIWNADFMTSLHAAFSFEWTVSESAAWFWQAVPKIVVGLAVFGHVVETITVIAKGVRHNGEKAVA